MSVLAKDLIQLNALPAPHGALTDHLLREIASELIGEGVPPASAAVFQFTANSRVFDEIDYFAGEGLTQEEAARHERWTTRHPKLCFALLAAAPLVVELLCRIAGAQ